MNAAAATLPFSKYHGLGNDFVLVDARSGDAPPMTPAEAEAMCDRNFGVGADGVIFVLPPTAVQGGSADQQYGMRIYNSDGSEPEMCGNGIRCMARYVAAELESKGAGDAATYSISTLAGPIVPELLPDGQIKVDMGEPILNGADVPCWYDPSDPERVKLSDGSPPLVAASIMLTVCLLALCCLVPLMLWMVSVVFEMYQTAYRQMPDDDDGATGAAKNDKTAVAVKLAPPLNRELSAKLDEVKAVVKPRTVQRSNSHFFHVGDLPPAVDVRLRHAFLRKVYGIVLAQVVLTAAVACGIMYSDTVSEWSIRHFGWMSWVAFIATLLLLFACAIYKNSYPHNYCLLLGFTLCQAYSIGVVCAMYRSVGLEETLLQAFVLTASLFVLLTLFTIQSKINFSFLGAGLYGALWLLIVTGILALWLHYEWLRTAYALAGSLLFCLFIIYDTFLITSKLGYDDYIIAAIELYLDIVNLFLFLLSLLSSKN